MRKASATHGGALPKSLMQRLTLLDQGVLPVATRKHRAGARQHKNKLAKQRIRACFGFGVAGGGALGGALLFVLFLIHPHQARTQRASLLSDASKPIPSSVVSPMQASSRLELTVRRDQAGQVAFPLRVSGVDDGENVRVVLRNVPATVQLSGGHHESAQTWVLRLGELEDLRMTVGGGTPEDFAVRVEVMLASGAELASAVARVRLVDGQQAIADGSMPLPPQRVDVPFQTEVIPAPAATGERAVTATLPKVVSTPAMTPAKAGVETIADARQGARPQLPEGLTALGGPLGVSPPPLSEKRVIWWKMPPANWTPFAGGASPN